MGRASHKRAGSYISIGSTLPAAELLALAERVAVAAEPTGPARGAKARIKIRSRSDDELEFWIGWKTPLMLFSVWAADHESGGGQLRSQIDQYRTSQSTVGGFLPTGPKQLDGWNWYLNFMLNLEATVKLADPVADIEIVEASS